MISGLVGRYRDLLGHASCVVAHLYADTRGVEVEFVSGEGTTIALETLSVEDVRPVGAREILHARPLESA